MWLRIKGEGYYKDSKDFIEFRDIITFIQNFSKLFTKHIIHRPKILVGPFLHSKQLCIIFFLFHNIQEMIYISFIFFLFLFLFLFLLTFTFFLPHTYLSLLTNFFNKYPLFLQYVSNILIHLKTRVKI